MTTHIHHVPGRLRIRMACLKRNAEKASEVTRKLQTVAGINSLHTNLVTGSVLVYYEPSLTNVNTLLGAAGVPATLQRAAAEPTRLQHSVANAFWRYAFEKAIERSVPLVIGALL